MPRWAETMSPSATASSDRTGIGTRVHASLLNAYAERVDRDYAAFRQLLDDAKRDVLAQKYAVAAVRAQIAAEFAWFNHAGIFASPELELLLAQLGARVTRSAWVRSPRDVPEEVLHVVTQTYQTGGPTQAISCWLEQDRERHHRVCITRQAASQIPEKIRAKLKDRRDLLRLDTTPGDLLNRAAALRAAAATADVVLLHTHPYDVVPVIAFGDLDDTPPVIYVNHGDHVFWLGASIARAVLNMRQSGKDLAYARRGIETARSLIAPRPLRVAERTMTREAAKSRLGIAADQVLLVTVADAPKYRAIAGPSLLDLLVPVLLEHPRVVMLAAGPKHEDEWAHASAKTQGRIRALGRIADATLLDQAADIYVDSYPFSSLTSLLEAGSYGAPAISYCGHPPSCAVLGADTPGVDEHLSRPRSAAAFAEEISALITDADLRETLGARLQAAISQTHKGDGWRARIAEAYRIAAKLPPPQNPRAAPQACDTLDIMVNAIMAETGYRNGAAGATRAHLGLLPVRTRFRDYRLLANAGMRVRRDRLISEWMLPWLAPAWRLAKRASRVVVGKRRTTGDERIVFARAASNA